MTHTTHLEEHDVLSYFWAMAKLQDVDRIALLRQLADVRLERPSDWDRQAVRQELEFMRPQHPMQPRGSHLTLKADCCWACGSREWRLYWHHVITVQHGGSSSPWNLVPICHAHHRAVHPWLPPGTTIEHAHGWTKLGDFAGRALERLTKLWSQKV